MNSPRHGGVSDLFSPAGLPLAVLLIAFCLVGGCKAPRVYHANPSVITDPQTNFYTAFIEFDDQGELWEPAQISNAVNVIRSNDPIFLVTFIHGWKNNAEIHNDNYRYFTNMLSALSMSLTDRDRRKVVGVYMAWRGDSILLQYEPVSWIGRQFSFFSRMHAAERVAGTSATEALYSLLKAANEQTNSKVVLMGHSMGALILEKTLSQALVGTLLSQSGGQAKPPADLVLLINSASSAIYARQLISMLERLPARDTATPNASGGPQSEAFSFEHPFIISATSEGDRATGTIFPIGMWFRGLTKSFRSYSTNETINGKQASFYRNTAAHKKQLLSHEIILNGDRKKRDQKLETLEAAREAFQTNIADTTKPEAFVLEERRYHSTYRIGPIAGAVNKTPYWVMKVPKRIIKDHGDIFNQRFTGLVGALFHITEMTQSGTRKDLRREQSE